MMHRYSSTFKSCSHGCRGAVQSWPIMAMLVSIPVMWAYEKRCLVVRSWSSFWSSLLRHWFGKAICQQNLNRCYDVLRISKIIKIMESPRVESESGIQSGTLLPEMPYVQYVVSFCLAFHVLTCLLTCLDLVKDSELSDPVKAQCSMLFSKASHKPGPIQTNSRIPSAGLFIFGFFFAAGFGFFCGFLVLCFPVSLLFCFSAFLRLCFSCFSASLLFCVSAFPASLLFCVSAFLRLCFSASLLFCVSAFPASLLFCFSAFLRLCFSASLLFCFSAFLRLCFSCFFAFLLLCFPCFSAFVLLCLSTSAILLFFSSVICFCCSTSCSFASLLPVFTVSLFFIFFCFILFCSYPKWSPRATLGETQRNPKEILIRNPTWKPK